MPKIIVKYIFIFSLLCAGMLSSVYADDSPPDTINGFEISEDVLTYTYENFVEKFRPIGVCVWLHHALIPYITTTPEVDEYLPDLVVSVYNELGDDPFEEANYMLDETANEVGNTDLKIATSALIGGSISGGLANGRNSSIRTRTHNNSDITKSVDVIGSPFNVAHLGYVTLQRDTTFYYPYFQSDADSVPGRLGFAEDLEVKYTPSPLGPYIGSSFENHWAYEFPRDMDVVNENDYKASLSIALHAADIVTNKSDGHIVYPTHDSCGKNCAVANVISPSEQHDINIRNRSARNNTIWQEVYPNNINKVKMGTSDVASTNPYGLGHSEEVAGNGNYVFVIWRHYKGCVQSHGKLIFATVKVPNTKKR